MNDDSVLAGPTRRDFLKHLALASGAGLLVSCTRNDAKPLPAVPSPTAPKAPARPNVLLVFTDEERYDLRFAKLSLPARDRLRTSGVEFTRHFVSYPLCTPSRAALLTGFYAHQLGITENTGAARPVTKPLDPAVPNLGSVFQKAGYDTAYFGKWHLSADLSTEAKPLDLSPFGFGTYWVSPGEDSGRLYDQTTADKAAAWIKAHDGAKPWCCVVSLIDPHDLFYPNWYSGVPQRDVVLAPNFADTPRPDLPPEALGEYRRMIAAVPPSRTEWTRLAQRYAFLVERTDRQLGQILDAVDSVDQRPNTLVVYTSDHGEMLGAHGLYTKRFFYEESIQVPLLISFPARYAGFRRDDGLAGNVDILPTIADLAGLSWPVAVPGQSLAHRGEPNAPKPADAVFSVSHLPAGLSTGLQDQALMVRTTDWKYFRYPGGAEELYNLTADPYELTDLARDDRHAAVKKDLKDRLQDWADRTKPL